jgi:hypothetical protein
LQQREKKTEGRNKERQKALAGTAGYVLLLAVLSCLVPCPADFGAANYGLGMDGWRGRAVFTGDGDKSAPAAAVAVRVVLVSCRVVSCRAVCTVQLVGGGPDGEIWARTDRDGLGRQTQQVNGWSGGWIEGMEGWDGMEGPMMDGLAGGRAGWMD